MFNLQKVRNQKNISLTKLSELTGISQRSLEDIERNGDTKYSTAEIIAEALGVKLEDFSSTSMEYKYHLVDASLRKQIDLNNHKKAIAEAVKIVFDLKPDIFSNYFVIKAESNLSPAKLRQMGNVIASNDAKLNAIVRKYTYTRSDGTQGTTHQLFKRFR